MIQNSRAGESRVVKIFSDEFRTPADCSRRCLSGRGHSVNVFFWAARVNMGFRRLYDDCSGTALWTTKCVLKRD